METFSVASAPMMVKGPENRTVLEGNDVTLFCEVGGAPLPNVTWYKNGTLQFLANPLLVRR